MLTLSKAKESGRLQEFIAQEEARGVGPINRAEFESLIGGAVKAPRSKRRTSHSSSGDGSSGTKTRRGNGPYASD